MSFVTYDIGLLILFTILLTIFLYRRKNNLKVEGILLLYRTKVGIKIIDRVAKKYSRLLEFLQPIIITSGIILMALGTYLLFKLAIPYLTSPTLARDLKVPVLTPLVPYIDKIFGINYFPAPLYFIYWAIILALVAIPHEFFHGIYARLRNVKVHSTGFGFLRIFKIPTPFLAFFVEPDEKQMAKKKTKDYMAMVASGTFANLLTTILLIPIIWIFFSLAFAPSGVYLMGYAQAYVNYSESTNIHTVNFANSTFLELTYANKTFFTSQDLLNSTLFKSTGILPAYFDSPAFNAQLNGVIISIDSKKIVSYSDLAKSLSSKQPGQTIKILTKENNELKSYNIILSNLSNKAFLGISLPTQEVRGVGILKYFGAIYKTVDPLGYNAKINGILYESFLGEFGIFVYYLLWWLILILFSVAVFNMLPAGIFDGGRFVYLIAFSLTKNKKTSEYVYKICTYALLALLVAMMLKWVIILF